MHLTALITALQGMLRKASIMVEWINPRAMHITPLITALQ
jgi:hypothetical protein